MTNILHTYCVFDKILKGNPKKHQLRESYYPTLGEVYSNKTFCDQFFFLFEFSSLFSRIWGLWSEILEQIFLSSWEQFWQQDLLFLLRGWHRTQFIFYLHTVDTFHASYFIWCIRDIYTQIYGLYIVQHHPVLARFSSRHLLTYTHTHDNVIYVQDNHKNVWNTIKSRMADWCYIMTKSLLIGPGWDFSSHGAKNLGRKLWTLRQIFE